METINLLAISNKGRSRIGTTITTAIVEQNHHDKLFVVISPSQCRSGVAHRELVQQALWIKKENDPDFRIISDGTIGDD